LLSLMPLPETSENDIDRRNLSGEDFARLWLADPRVWPPSAVVMGVRPLEADAERGYCKNAFDVGDQFANPIGGVQGGHVAAMLDDTMAVGALFKLGGNRYLPTLEMKLSYQKPVALGEVIVEGWLVHAGRSIAFLEGQIRDAEGALCVRSSATAVIKTFK
jgi:uncharacterized protein (TIGR00369 family)